MLLLLSLLLTFLLMRLTTIRNAMRNPECHTGCSGRCRLVNFCEHDSFHHWRCFYLSHQPLIVPRVEPIVCSVMGGLLDRQVLSVIDLAPLESHILRASYIGNVGSIIPRCKWTGNLFANVIIPGTGGGQGEAIVR